MSAIFSRLIFWRVVLILIAIGKVGLWVGSIGFWVWAAWRGMELDLAGRQWGD